MAGQVGNAMAAGVEALAKLEADYPGATAAIKAEANKEFAAANLTPAQKNDVVVVGGVIVVAVTALLALTGHPVQAGEVDGLVAGLTFIGHYARNR